MLTLHGKGVSGGVAIGRARLMHRDPINITSETVQNPNEEWQRYQLALKQTVNQLERLYVKISARTSTPPVEPPPLNAIAHPIPTHAPPSVDAINTAIS